MLTHYERVRPYFTAQESKAQAFVREVEKAGHELWEAFPLAVQLKRFDADGLVSVLWAIVRRIVEQLEDPYSFGLLSADTQFKKLAAVLSQGSRMPRADLMVTLVTEHHMLAHELAGRRVYDVSEGLADRLAHTELRGLVTDDLRLPYESVYLITPPASGLRVFNTETGWHRCDGLYIAEDHYVWKDEPEARLTDIFVQMPEHREQVRGWRILACGEPLEDTKPELGMKYGNDALSFFKVFLPAGKKLDEAVRDTQQRVLRDLKAGAGQSFQNMEHEWERLFRWAMNAMLYATWTEPGERWIANREARQLWQRIQKLPPRSKKRRNLNRRFQNLDSQRRIRLGQSIRVDRTQQVGTGGSGNGKPLMVRTRVSGHWRNQPHGPGRTQRKLIWIEPHMRGPEDGVAGATRHRMQ